MELETTESYPSWRQRRRLRGFQQRRSIDEAMQFAADCVKRAGFKLVCVSRSDVSCYYSYPGRYGLIRISDHSKSSQERNVTGPIISSITFTPGQLQSDGLLHMTDDQIEHLVVIAIGRFILRTERDPSGQSTPDPL